MELLGPVKTLKWFPTAEMDVAGRLCIPVELKVLAALQTLGRASFFDDISQMSLMSESTACASFHTFCDRCAKTLYHAHVRLPTDAAHDKAMAEYDELEWSGAIGWTDVMHVKWDCCPFSDANSHTGKEGYPTIAYQVTVDRTGRALSVTQGFAGAQSDKTTIRYDFAVQKIRNDRRYTEKIFKLRREDGTMMELQGNWLVVDNGYHKWRAPMEPTKCPLDVADTKWSKWLESVRKDVECFFGILKGRFRILKLPLLFRNKVQIDNIFFTCRILHNILHTFDGLGDLEAGVKWSGEDGLHNPQVAEPSSDCSFVRRGTREQYNAEKTEVEPLDDVLKRQLITSITYRQAHNEIRWLTT